MEIIKNKYKSKCMVCGKKIDSSYKVRSTHMTFHMNCYRPWVMKAITDIEERLKKLKAFAKLFQRHHKEMIIEALEKNTR